ncbi:MAG: hypothetical protein DHS20C05_11140 [Hyphococcus sp.]|nr:MAG: hypothetical protein DHS20C05_11140 [Marinicaulis sp.]
MTGAVEQSRNKSDPNNNVGVVIIGRNEGERLIACLKSALRDTPHVVYVDSGSTDDSAEAARKLGAKVVALDMTKPFTAARARNAGVEKLKQTSTTALIQFVDGDCEIVEGWIDHAVQFLSQQNDVAAVCGRRRERFPEATIYNRLVDQEWATPIGEAQSCGGDVLMRMAAFDASGGYNPGLIAGEEPEFCVRLRAKGWKIWRLDAEMTRHDIAMTSLGQWLKRARRAGHAFAEVSDLHHGTPEQIWARETLRAFFWTGLGIAGLAGGALIHPLLFMTLLIIPLQIIRMALRDKPATKTSWAHASLIMLQKPWEAAGAIQYWLGKISGKNQKLIEYK